MVQAHDQWQLIHEGGGAVHTGSPAGWYLLLFPENVYYYYAGTFYKPGPYVFTLYLNSNKYCTVPAQITLNASSDASVPCICNTALSCEVVDGSGVFHSCLSFTSSGFTNNTCTCCTNVNTGLVVLDGASSPIWMGTSAWISCGNCTPPVLSSNPQERWQLTYGYLDQTCPSFSNNTTIACYTLKATNNTDLEYYYLGAMGGTGPWDFQWNLPCFDSPPPTPTCTLPPILSLSAITPPVTCTACCSFPPTLTANITLEYFEGFSAVYCDCAGGMSGFNITMTQSPVDLHWYGSGAFGSCPGTIALNLWTAVDPIGSTGCNTYLNVVYGGDCFGIGDSGKTNIHSPAISCSSPYFVGSISEDNRSISVQPCCPTNSAGGGFSTIWLTGCTIT